MQALGTGWVRWLYEGVMVALALAVAALLAFPDEGVVRAANLTIWGVFVVDYFVRLALSTNRRAFFKANVPDLIAILPLDFFRLARLARLARLVRLVRAGTVLWRVSKDVRGVVSTNGLGYVLALNATLVVVGGLAISAVEPAIGTLGDALWWSLVTATTVGYGDISPATGVGRVVAGLLMVIGIGTIGMVTGSIATYFIHGRQQDGDPEIEHIRDRLAEWPKLNSDERRRLVRMLEACTDEHDERQPQ